MRAHFPGALHEVRSAARFPSSVVHNGFVVRHSFLTNSKEEDDMEKTLTNAAGAAVPDKQEQNLPTESKSPLTGGARRHRSVSAHSNADWRPNSLTLKILRRI